MKFSIIMPVLNEAGTLPHAFKHLLSTIDYLSQVEIILSDGGSTDDSFNVAKQFPAIVLHADAGRAKQMNRGADQAIGDWLIFLHADTRLPQNWMQLIEQTQSNWGFFQVRLSGRNRLLRMVEKMMNLRSRKTAIGTGDQVLFFRRDFFQQINGFPDIPLMEDIAISKKARQTETPEFIKQQVITSSRRWEKNGILRTIVLMWWLRFSYWLGVSPKKLHKQYYS